MNYQHNRILLLFLFLGFVLSGCSSGDDDDSTPVVNTNIRVANFQVTCWVDETDNYWMFSATIEDDDGPQDIVGAQLEIIDSSFTVVKTVDLEVVSANGEFCSEFGTTIAESLDCVECGSYGYRVRANDEAYNQAEKTYPGDICDMNSGYLPDTGMCPGASDY